MGPGLLALSKAHPARAQAVFARLPEGERPGWQKLWQEVEVFRQRALQGK
jgi:hypothetical protein